MIRKLISRVLGRKNPPPIEAQAVPTIISAQDHPIRSDNISSGARRTVEALQQQGYQAYVVGGAVRDLLAGMTPKDYDVATNATPEEVRRCFRRARLIGRRFQIVHVLMGAETIEVTTFRGHHVDKKGAKPAPRGHLNHKAQTDEQGRVLRDNVFGNQEDDAARRDFTINALYFDPSNETIVDYHHGLADLQAQTLRMIGDPATRYREDPVRMLRAVRLAAKLGFSLERTTREPIHEMCALLANVPPSRLFDEMLKLLTSGYAVKCLARLRAEGLHHGLLPLLDTILEQPLGERFVMLTLENTDQRVREGKSISPGFLFATLLWHQVLVKWNEFKAGGARPTPALFQAMDHVLEVQAEKLAITRRVMGDIKDIWALQPRFDNRSGKRPYALLEQARFKAGYDFLLLRAESGEISTEISLWWGEFLQGDSQTRASLLQPAKAPENKKRRRKPKTRAAENELPVALNVVRESAS